MTIGSPMELGALLAMGLIVLGGILDVWDVLRAPKRPRRDEQQ
jgi:hypothetical protein